MNFPKTVEAIFNPNEWFQFPRHAMHVMSANEALLFFYLQGEACRFSKKMNDGWFYATVQSVYDGLGMSEDIQFRTLKKLISKGFVSSKRMGIPAKRHFKVHLYKFIESFESTLEQDPAESRELESAESREQDSAKVRDLTSRSSMSRSNQKKEREADASHARKDGFSFGEDVSAKRKSPILTDRDVDHAKRLREILIKNTKQQNHAKQPIGLKSLATCMYRLRKKKISDERVEGAISFLEEAYDETWTPKLYRKDDFFEKFDRVEAARVRYYSGEEVENDDVGGHDAWKRRHSLILKIREAMGPDFDFDRRAPQELVDKALVKLGMSPGSVKTGEVV